MLIWLRNKEKDIASTAIAMFVGSWLLLFCQTCFAALQDADSISSSQNETGYSCHTTDNEINKPEEQYNFDEGHCLGVCDCDEITASFNSVEKNSVGKTVYSDKYHKVFLDIIPPSNSFKNKIASNLTHHRLLIPERATLLPLKRYAVLLI